MKVKSIILSLIISCLLAAAPVCGEDATEVAVSAEAEEGPLNQPSAITEEPSVALPPPIPAVPEAQPAVAPVSAEPEKVTLPNIFEREGLGYTIGYPADWVYEEPTQYQIVFSGKKGTSAYYSTVSVQNIASKKLDGKHDSIASVKTSLIDQLNASAIDVRVSDEKLFTYEKEGTPKLTGAELVAEYTNNKTRFKQWIVIVERVGKEIYHVWSYTSPIEQYDAYLPSARDILESWIIK